MATNHRKIAKSLLTQAAGAHERGNYASASALAAIATAHAVLDLDASIHLHLPEDDEPKRDVVGFSAVERA